MSGIDRSKWKTVKLGDVCEIFGGGTPSTTNPTYWDGGIPWLSVVDFNTDEKYVNETEKRITDIGLKSSSTQLLRTNDIIISARGTVGVLAILAKPMAFNQSCFGLHSNNDICNSDYLYYALNASITQMKQHSTMGVFSALTYKGLHSLLLTLPSYQEQQKINRALTAFDSLISSLRRLIAKQESIKKGTLKLLLTPKPGWKTVKLGNVADIDCDCLTTTTNPEYRFKYISLECVDRGILQNLFDLTFVNAPSRARRIVKKNDVLVSTVRPNLMSHYFVKEVVSDLICSTGFSVVRCHKTLLFPAFFYAYLFTCGLNQQIESLITGSNYPSITSNDVKHFEVPLPPIEDQKRIAEILMKLDMYLETLRAKLIKAQQLKAGMMRYFFG